MPAAVHVPPCICAAVEGPTDEAVVRRLLVECGLPEPRVYGRQGRAAIRKSLEGYNAAAKLSPWVVLVDLDTDAECVPTLVADWLPSPSVPMCFRVAVREVEAWLLADAKRLSAFLSVSPARLPHAPDTVEHPKEFVVNLARRSRQRAVREDMVPRPPSGRSVGPAYGSRLSEFVTEGRVGWRPDVAAQASPSLRSCLRALRRLAETVRA